MKIRTLVLILAVPTTAVAVGMPAVAKSIVAKPKARVVDDTPLPDASDPDRERILRMQEALSSLVHGPVLGRVRAAVTVREAGSGRTFYSRRQGVLMDPASNQKVLATTTALMRLGHNWRFRTEVFAPPPDASGVIAGDLHLRGSGDPSLRADQLTALADMLQSRGVTRVEGAVLADPKRIGSDESGPDERPPVRVSRAAVIIRVRPGDRPGAPAEVSLRPASDAFLVRNLVVTRAQGRSRVTASLATVAGRLVVTVSGRIAERHPGVVLRRVPPAPLLYAALLFRAALIDAGVEVRGPPGVVGAKSHAVAGGENAAGSAPIVLAVSQSDELGVLVRHINKDSDNEYAERLLETVGAELYGGAASGTKGVRALREAITELGLAPSAYLPTNGSGLGHANRITVDAMADLLRRLYLDPRVGPEIMQSLSVGGVDGTTRNRFRGSPAAERVRAKTGTLRGKSCLSGFVGDGSDILVFSILCDGLRGRRLAMVRHAQVTAVNAMMRYVRGAEGPIPGDEVEPASDLEVGDEALDAEDDESDPARVHRPGVGPAPVAARPTTGPAGPDPDDPDQEN